MINNSKLAGAKNPEAKDFLSNLPVTNPQVNCLPHKLRSTSQHCLIKRYGVKNGKQTVFFSKRRKNSLLFTQYTSPYCVLVLSSGLGLYLLVHVGLCWVKNNTALGRKNFCERSWKKKIIMALAKHTTYTNYYGIGKKRYIRFIEFE